MAGSVAVYCDALGLRQFCFFTFFVSFYWMCLRACVCIELYYSVLLSLWRNKT